MRHMCRGPWGPSVHTPAPRPVHALWDLAKNTLLMIYPVQTVTETEFQSRKSAAQLCGVFDFVVVVYSQRQIRLILLQLKIMQI